MTLHITADRITSSVSPHSATRTMATAADAIPGGATMWSVTWLNRRLTRNDAITAMTIVEEAGGVGAVVDSLAGELGLTGDEAIRLVAETLPAVEHNARIDLPVHDTHAIPAGDEPDHLAAYLAQNPKVGAVFTARGERHFFVVRDADDGELMLVNEAGEWCDPVDVCEYDGPLTRVYPVAGEAIDQPSLVLVGDRFADDDGDIWTAVWRNGQTQLYYNNGAPGGLVRSIESVRNSYGPLTKVEPERPVADLALPVSDTGAWMRADPEAVAALARDADATAALVRLGNAYAEGGTL